MSVTFLRSKNLSPIDHPPATEGSPAICDRDDVDASGVCVGPASNTRSIVSSGPRLGV